MQITQNIGRRTITIREGGIPVIIVDESEENEKKADTCAKYAVAIINFLRSGCPKVQLFFSQVDSRIIEGGWVSYLRIFFDLAQESINGESFKISSFHEKQGLQIIEVSREVILRKGPRQFT